MLVSSSQISPRTSLHLFSFNFLLYHCLSCDLMEKTKTSGSGHLFSVYSSHRYRHGQQKYVQIMQWVSVIVFIIYNHEQFYVNTTMEKHWFIKWVAPPS